MTERHTAEGNEAGTVDWAISALTGVASLLQRERDRGRIVVEGVSGWPAADPFTITGQSVAWVRVTNLMAHGIQVDGVGFLVGKVTIPVLGNSTVPMPAYLPPGQSFMSMCPLANLAYVSLGVDGAYADVAGIGRRRAPVDPHKLFYPLAREMGAAA
jgi:hypothetical protein